MTRTGPLVPLFPGLEAANAIAKQLPILEGAMTQHMKLETPHSLSALRSVMQ
jgi:hypothetical protein